MGPSADLPPPQRSPDDASGKPRWQSLQGDSKQALRVNGETYSVVRIFKASPMPSAKPESDNNSRYQVMMRKPQRISITLSWSMYQALVEESNLQGRSISNLACYWLERHYAMAKSRGEA